MQDTIFKINYYLVRSFKCLSFCIHISLIATHKCTNSINSKGFLNTLGLRQLYPLDHVLFFKLHWETEGTNSENALDLLNSLEFYMIFRNCLIIHYHMSWFSDINSTTRPTCQACFPGNL